MNCTPLSKHAYVDIGMWEKIVLNLLSNAFKYTLSGGITVTLEQVRVFMAFSYRAIATTDVVLLMKGGSFCCIESLCKLLSEQPC